jgi:hypothetical protein
VTYLLGYDSSSRAHFGHDSAVLSYWDPQRRQRTVGCLDNEVAMTNPMTQNNATTPIVTNTPAPPPEEDTTLPRGEDVRRSKGCTVYTSADLDAAVAGANRPRTNREQERAG